MRKLQYKSIMFFVTFFAFLLFNVHLGNLKTSSQAVISEASSELYLIQWNTILIMRDLQTPRSLIQTNDGNYLVIGNRYPTPSESCCPLPQSDIFLMKIASNGMIKEINIYGDDNIAIDSGNIVIETENGWVIAGHTNAPPAVGMDFMLLKIDLEGKQMWKRTYNRSTEGEIRSFIRTADQGFALLGLSSPRTPIPTDETMWLLKTDNDGVVQWNRTYGQNFTEYTSMIQSEDGGFVFTSYDGYLMKTDMSGEIQWQKEIGGTLFSLTSVEDGGFVLFGSKFNHPWLIKTDSLGIMEWNKTLPFSIEGEYVFSKNRTKILNIISSSDSGFILTGTSVPVPDGGIINNSNVWIAKTDSNGIIEWSHVFEIESFASIQAVIQNNEGDIVLTGENKRYPWIIKIDLPPFAPINPSETVNIAPTISLDIDHPTTTSTNLKSATISFPEIYLILLVVSIIGFWKKNHKV
ncbi:MAG: hypothetical protein ACFFB2_09075 [Promethearchaeota archaeon]